MPTLEEGLRAHLIADGTLGPLLNAGGVPAHYRIYHEIMPPNPGYPAIVYARVSVERFLTLAGPNSLTNVRLALDIWGNTASEMKTVAQAVRDALDGLQGSIGGTTIQSCHYESEADLSIFEGDRSDRRVAYQFVFWLNEE